jgi:predicted glycogen debranching enzyme
MRFVYGKQELCTRQRAEDVSVLLTNGLGGYLSTTAAFSAPRCDQGLLAAAVQAPNRRVMLVHRLKEVLRIGQKETFLSTQSFAEEAAEDGWKNLSSFTYQYTPCWRYHVGGVMVERKLALGWEENTAAALYTVENRSGRPCTLEIVPQLKFAPKEDALKKPDKTFRFENGKVTSGGETMHVFTDAALAARPVQWEKLHYTADEKDGRPAFGYAASCFSITRTVEAGETAQFEVVFFTGETAASGTELLRQQEMRLAALEKKAGFADPAASQLAAAADAFIARRASTNGKTILAGYPLFSDWGRDTMIALPGCCLETGRYEDAKSILRTFLAYEKDGLVPNLFPEGAQKPMYNTVDAALLLIEGVWLYIQRSGDHAFLHEAYPVMERIIAAYRKGTHHGIRMDADGLITAGEGLDQVTWMDVCVNGILPTPRQAGGGQRLLVQRPCDHGGVCQAAGKRSRLRAAGRKGEALFRRKILHAGEGIPEGRALGHGRRRADPLQPDLGGVDVLLRAVSRTGKERGGDGLPAALHALRAADALAGRPAVPRQLRRRTACA